MFLSTVFAIPYQRANGAYMPFLPGGLFFINNIFRAPFSQKA